MEAQAPIENVTWNLKALRDYVRGNVREPTLCLDLINSMDRSILILRYHAYSANHAMDGFIDDEEQVKNKHFVRVFGASSDHAEFNQAQLVNQAHTLAAFHAVRAMYDMFSQLINQLLLDTKLDVSVCNIHKATEALPDSELKSRLKKLLDSDWFKYVSAFTNTSKHKALVGHGFNIDFQKDIAAVRFREFEFKGVNYPAYTSHKVLLGLLEVKNEIVSSGRELNHSLALSD